MPTNPKDAAAEALQNLIGMYARRFDFGSIEYVIAKEACEKGFELALEHIKAQPPAAESAFDEQAYYAWAGSIANVNPCPTGLDGAKWAHDRLAERVRLAETRWKAAMEVGQGYHQEIVQLREKIAELEAENKKLVEKLATKHVYVYKENARLKSALERVVKYSNDPQVVAEAKQTLTSTRAGESE